MLVDKIWDPPVDDVIRGLPDPTAADDDEDHDDDQDGRQGVGRLRVVQHVRAQHSEGFNSGEETRFCSVTFLTEIWI